jgi:leader peptidase (prepilin peptidase)/N-methyltransferase
VGRLRPWMDLADTRLDRLFDSFLLPDVLTLPLLLAGLTRTTVTDPEALTDHSLAAALRYLSFQALAFAYRRFRGREGLGGGDTKLIAADGARCGLTLLPFIVLGSAVLACSQPWDWRSPAKR